MDRAGLAGVGSAFGGDAVMERTAGLVALLAACGGEHFREMVAASADQNSQGDSGSFQHLLVRHAQHCIAKQGGEE